MDYLNQVQADKNLPLAGRVALITGVSRSRGIGFSIAKRLAQHGADLFLQGWTPYDRDKYRDAASKSVAELLSELRTTGRRIEYLEADFLDPHTPAQLIQAAVQAFTHINMLIINHTYSSSGYLEDLTAQQIDMHLQVNVRGSLLLVKEWAAQHDGRLGGRVILMTSGQHLQAMSTELAYVASKGALHQLTLSLSSHLISRGITVNTINPGATDTGYATPTLYQHVLTLEPQGRWGQPEDAARIITWLATDDAQWITGQIINSTGGGP
jgi:3-oxoacyl-[acyl-carrier protein] reductase